MPWDGAPWPELKPKFEAQMRSWFAERGIGHMWSRDARADSHENRAIYYRFNRPATPWTTERMSRAKGAFQGTFIQAIRALTESGGELFESNHTDGRGGESHSPGVFCSPVFGYTGFYAWGTNVFNDGLFHGAVYDVVIDPQGLHKDNHRNIGGDNHEYRMKTTDVWLRGLWMLADKHVKETKQRFYAWKREQEILPPGKQRPPNPNWPVLQVLS